MVKLVEPKTKHTLLDRKELAVARVMYDRLGVDYSINLIYGGKAILKSVLSQIDIRGRMWYAGQMLPTPHWIDYKSRLKVKRDLAAKRSANAVTEGGPIDDDENVGQSSYGYVVVDKEDDTEDLKFD